MGLIKNEKETIENIRDTIATNLLEELKSEVVSIKTEYVDAAGKMWYEKSEGAIVSDDYGLAVLNAGRVPGEFPNFDRIRWWVQNVKDGGSNRNLSDRELDEIAYKVGLKIQNEGIEPHWFIDNVLGRYS